jgi:hypothetical protein
MLAIESEMSILAKTIVRAVEIDVTLKIKHRAQLFDRDRPLSLFEARAGKHRISKEKIQKALKLLDRSRAPNRLVEIDSGDVLSIACGKVVIRLVFHVFRSCVAKIGAKQMSLDTFIRLAISEAFELAGSGKYNQLQSHHKSQMECFS